MTTQVRHWTLADDELLETSSLPTPELAALLGRTVVAIHQRRFLLGIPAPSRKVTVCRVCGGPRYAETTHALCETHYLEYFRVKTKESRQRKRVSA